MTILGTFFFPYSWRTNMIRLVYSLHTSGDRVIVPVFLSPFACPNFYCPYALCVPPVLNPAQRDVLRSLPRYFSTHCTAPAARQRVPGVYCCHVLTFTPAEYTMTPGQARGRSMPYYRFTIFEGRCRRAYVCFTLWERRSLTPPSY